jgi:hypothetical protein
MSEKVPTKRIFTVSASSLDSIETCGQYLEYEKIMRLEPKKKARPLDYGGLGHFMLHPYYFGQIKDIKDHHMKHPYRRLLGKSHLDLINISVQIGTLYSLGTDLSIEDREKAIQIFREYVGYYGVQRFDPLEVETPFSVTLYDSEHLQILFEGIADLIVNDHREGIYPMDHKFMGRDNHKAETGHQINGTCWALKSKIFKINKILERKENPFVRDVYNVDAEQAAEWAQDAVQSAMRGIHYIDEKYFPRVRASCDKFGGCKFLTICKSLPSTREFKIDGFYNVRKEEHNLYAKDGKIDKIMRMIMGENDGQ